MCTAVVFVTVKTWKLCKCPLTDEWIKKSAVCVEYEKKEGKRISLGFSASATERYCFYLFPLWKE